MSTVWDAPKYLIFYKDLGEGRNDAPFRILGLCNIMRIIKHLFRGIPHTSFSFQCTFEKGLLPTLAADI